MTGKVKAQWVVRLPDRLVLLPQPLQAIRVFSTAEVLKYKTYYGTGEWKSRIERQYDANTQNDTVTVEYWVLLLPLDDTIPLEVLCCTVQRATADRILDSLWCVMFTNCGDNTYVDLRELLAADLVTPEQVANTPTTGRFVDLGDGEPHRPAVTTGSIATAAIPVQTVPTRHMAGTRLDEAEATTVASVRSMINQPASQWIRTAGIGGSMGRANSNADIFATSGEARLDVDMRVARQDDTIPARQRSAVLPRGINIQQQLADRHTGIVGNTSDRGAADPMAGYRPAPQEARSTANMSNLPNVDIEQVRALPADLAAIMQQSTVPNIGRGMDRNADALSPRDRDRLQTQLHAAAMRQQAENRNTHAVLLPGDADYSDYLQPLDFSDVPPVPPDNDAVDRVDPDF